MTPRAPKTPVRVVRKRASKPAKKNLRKPTPKAAAKQRSLNLRWVGLGLLVVALAGGLSGGAYLGWTALINSGSLQVKHITISGNRAIGEEQIAARLDLAAGINLPQVDLAAVSSAVLSHPWIGHVTVRRRYPDTLWIRVWERSPAGVLWAAAPAKKSRKKARQPAAVLVDRDGVVLGKAGAESPHLPRLLGTTRDHKPLTYWRLLKLVAGDKVNQMQVRRGLAIARAYRQSRLGGVAPVQVDVTDLRDPLLLVDGMRVRMGDKGGYEWRVQRLVQLRPELRELAGEKGTEVDLRLRDRVVARPL